MNKGTSILLAASLVSGGAAAYFMNEQIESRVAERRAEIDQKYQPVEAVVAAYDIRVGELLTFENLLVREVPSGFLHADAITPEIVDNIVGRKLMYPIRRGEVVLQSHASTKVGSNFSTMIPDGERALTFPVDQVSSVNGLLRPGDRIDLVVTMDNTRGDTVTRALLTDVTVLATGVSVDELSATESGDRYQTITLSVSSESAAKIIHAREAGSLSVVLRGPTDSDPGFDKPINDKSLMNEPRRVAKKGIEIIRGGRR